MDKLDEIFDCGKRWKNKYQVTWCDLCVTAIITCPSCNNSSCNGGGCKLCDLDFDEFNRNKIRVEAYLTKEEIQVFRKAEYLKKYILQSIKKGKTEIDFKKLQADGELSVVSEKLFSDRLT